MNKQPKFINRLTAKPLGEQSNDFRLMAKEAGLEEKGLVQTPFRRKPTEALYCQLSVIRSRIANYLNDTTERVRTKAGERRHPDASFNHTVLQQMKATRDNLVLQINRIKQTNYEIEVSLGRTDLKKPKFERVGEPFTPRKLKVNYDERNEFRKKVHLARLHEEEKEIEINDKQKSKTRQTKRTAARMSKMMGAVVGASMISPVHAITDLAAGVCFVSLLNIILVCVIAWKYQHVLKNCWRYAKLFRHNLHVPAFALVGLFQDEELLDQTRQKSERLCSGGFLAMGGYPNLCTVTGNIFMKDECQWKVVHVISRFKWNNVPVIFVRSVKEVGERIVADVYLIPSNYVLDNYREIRKGEYAHHPGSRVVSQDAFLVVQGLCPYFLPIMSDYYLVVYPFVWMWAFGKIVLFFIFGKGEPKQIVVSLVILQQCYNQKLNTLRNSEGPVADSVIGSHVQDRFPQYYPQSVIDTTAGLFKALVSTKMYSSSSLAGFGLEVTVLPEVSTFLVGADAPLASIYIGKGFSNSSVMTNVPEVVFNNNVRLMDRSKGVTFENGQLKFTTPFEKSRTVYFYGPHVASACTQYTVLSTSNIEASFTRITNSRENEVEYRANAELICSMIMTNWSHLERRRPVWAGIIHKLELFNGTWHYPNRQNIAERIRTLERDLPFQYLWAESVTNMFSNYLALILQNADVAEQARVTNTVREDLVMAFANEEHPKRKARQLCVQNFVDLPFLWDKPITKVVGKVKWETAKYEKVPRQYISLGEEATLFNPEAPRYMKHLMEVPINIDNGSMVFMATPTIDLMTKFAEDVTNFHRHVGEIPEYLGYYHSDDSHFCCKVYIGGHHCAVSVDADIKKCDLSHSPPLFGLLLGYFYRAGFSLEHTTPLFLQMMQNIVLRHPDKTSSDVAFFELAHIMLMTGSTLTTLVNNFACILILCALRKATAGFPWFPDQSSLRTTLIQAAKTVGYEITVDLTVTVVGALPKLQQVMFLKHFIATDTANRSVAVKCLSTLIRSYGISEEPCDCVERRREILLGWLPSVPNIYLEQAFRCAKLDYVVDQPYVKAEEFEARYGVSDRDILEGLTMLFSGTDVCLIGHPALDAIVRVGYGLPRIHP